MSDVDSHVQVQRTAAHLKAPPRRPPQASVAGTGLWDPLMGSDRVQAQLTSSCSFLSHAKRMEAGRVEGGEQPGERCWNGHFPFQPVGLIELHRECF